LFVWLVMLVVGSKMLSEEAAMVAGTQQNLSNLLFFRYLWWKCLTIAVAQHENWTQHRHLIKLGYLLWQNIDFIVVMILQV